MLQVEIHHARSVIEYFDAISYKKGSAVIRMLQDFLGNEIFQVGKLDNNLYSIWLTELISLKFISLQNDMIHGHL